VLQVVSVAEYPLARNGEKLLIGLGQGALVNATALFRDFRYLDGSVCGITTETFEPDL
jgi:hypothetical protein